MKSILLKIEDELYEEVETSSRELNTSKTVFIQQALESYIKAGKRTKLENELKKEIEEIKRDELDRKLISEFEEASLKDLKKHLDD